MKRELLVCSFPRSAWECRLDALHPSLLLLVPMLCVGMPSRRSASPTYFMPDYQTVDEIATQFPLETLRIPINHHIWQITCVTDQGALLEGINDAEHVPYGFLLWESAIALAELIAQQGDALHGKRVLELGTGVGLVGLVARSLGAIVWQTDHRADVLQLADHNARQNQISLPHQFVADWRSWTRTEHYDLILGADILYEREMHRHLAPIFRANLAPGGSVILADPSRPQALELIAKLEDEGWQVGIEMRTLTLPLPARTSDAVDVALLTCQR